MIQTQQQAVKPNKTSTRQNLKRVSHLWLQTKNQISTLRINPDRHFDMPLVEPNLPSTRHYFSQTQNSCFMPPIGTTIFNQSQGRPATFCHQRNESTTRRDSIGKSTFHCGNTFNWHHCQFFPKINPSRTHLSPSKIDWPPNFAKPHNNKKVTAMIPNS